MSRKPSFVINPLDVINKTLRTDLKAAGITEIGPTYDAGRNIVADLKAAGWTLIHESERS